MTEYKMVELYGTEVWDSAMALIGELEDLGYAVSFDSNAYPFVANHLDKGDVVYATMKVRIVRPADYEVVE